MSSFYERLKDHLVEYLIVTILLGGTLFSIKAWYDLKVDHNTLKKNYTISKDETAKSFKTIKQCLLTLMITEGVDPKMIQPLISAADLQELESSLRRKKLKNNNQEANNYHRIAQNEDNNNVDPFKPLTAVKLLDFNKTIEKIDPQKLKLVAIFKSPKKNVEPIAVVEDHDRNRFIVQNGTMIGPNGWEVTKIASDEIIISARNSANHGVAHTLVMKKVQ